MAISEIIKNENELNITLLLLRGRLLRSLCLFLLGLASATATGHVSSPLSHFTGIYFRNIIVIIHILSL